MSRNTTKNIYLLEIWRQFSVLLCHFQTVLNKIKGSEDGKTVRKLVALFLVNKYYLWCSNSIILLNLNNTTGCPLLKLSYLLHCKLYLNIFCARLCMKCKFCNTINIFISKSCLYYSYCKVINPYPANVDNMASSYQC